MILSNKRMRYQRTSAKEKAEIMQLVRKSSLSVKETLAGLGLARSTYYWWRRREQRRGQQGNVVSCALAPKNESRFSVSILRIQTPEEVR